MLTKRYNYYSSEREVIMNQVLKLLRIANGWSVTEMAEKLNVSQSFLSKVESGNKKPSRELVQKYSEVLKMKVSAIEFFDEERAENNMDYQELLLEILKKIVKRKERKNKENDII